MSDTISISNREFRIRHKYIELLLVIFSMLIITILMIRPFYGLTHKFSHNYNEGWNAYHADNAFDPDSLYPDSSYTVTNNYPPVSFYIVGSLGNLIKDNIIAGRIVNITSFIVVILNITFLSFKLNNSKLGSIFAGFIFTMYAATMADDYIGTNTPQMLAHAFMTTGLLIFFRFREKQDRAIFISVFFFLMGGFIKHNLVPIPLTITIWLFLYDRRGFKIWLATSIVGLLLLFSFFFSIYGSHFIDSILLERRFDFSHAKIREWMIPLLPLIGVALLLFSVDIKSKVVHFFSLLVIVSGCWGLFNAQAVGVHVNSIIDLLIALSFTAGIFIARLDEYSSFSSHLKYSAILYLLFPIMLLLPGKLIQLKNYYDTVAERLYIYDSEISFVESLPGPAACRDYAVCYWGKKKFEMDFFNTREKQIRGLIDEDDVEKLFTNKYFSSIQLFHSDISADGRPLSALSEKSTLSLQKNYRIHHKNNYTILLVKRQRFTEPTVLSDQGSLGP